MSLLIETPKANLSISVRQLMESTLKVNRRHKRVEHLVQVGFKAILVEKNPIS